MDELIKRLEMAEGPDRELDISIFRHLSPPDESRVTGVVLPPGFGRDEISLIMDPAPFYTSSLDAALTLVPEGWFWRCGYTPSFKAWAHIQKTHSDHTEPNKTEFTAKCEHYQPIAMTVPMAVCIASLRARSSKG